ncbi:hypothetical protein DRO33_04845, partial [Candidatus Bathyarchaeota archaeon]
DFVDNYVEWPPGSGMHISDYPPYERAQKYYEFLDWFFSQYNAVLEPAHYSLWWDNVIFYREIEGAENLVVAYTVERAIRVAMEHGAGLLVMGEHGYREWWWAGSPVASAEDTTVVDRMNALLELVGADLRMGRTPIPGEWEGDWAYMVNVTKDWMVDHPITRGVSHFTMAAFELAGFMTIYENHTFVFVGTPAGVNDTLIESPHPYPPNAHLVYVLRHPGAYKIRLHFYRWELEPNYVDAIYIYDENWTLIDWFNPDHHGASGSDLWTEWVPGETVYIVLTSDSIHDGSWGFRIDMYEWCVADGAYPIAYALNPYTEMIKPVIAVDDVLPDYPEAAVVVIGDHQQFSNYFFSHWIPVRFETGLEYCRWDIPDLAVALLVYATGFWHRVAGGEDSWRDWVVNNMTLVEQFIAACEDLGIDVSAARAKLDMAEAELEAGDSLLEELGCVGAPEAWEHYVKALQYIKEAFDLAVDAAHDTATSLKSEYEAKHDDVVASIDEIAAAGIDVSAAYDYLADSERKKSEGDRFLEAFDPEKPETAVALLNATKCYREALDLLDAAKEAAKSAARDEAEAWIEEAEAKLSEAKALRLAPADKIEAAEAALSEARSAFDAEDYLTAIDKAKEAYDLAKDAIKIAHEREEEEARRWTYIYIGAGAVAAIVVVAGLALWLRRRA